MTSFLPPLTSAERAPFLAVVDAFAASDFKALEQLPLKHVHDAATSKIAMYEEAMRRMQVTLRQLKEVSNSAVPLHLKLPPEVLIHVFRMFTPAGYAEIDVRVAHVCRHWRQLVLHTPEFWANLLGYPTISRRAYLPDKAILPIVERSIPLPFSLKLEEYGVQCIPQLGVHLYRLCALTLHISEVYVNYFIRLELPVLEDLRCKRWGNQGSRLFTIRTPAPPPVEIRLPRLRTLSTDVYCFVSPLAAPSLRHLCYRGEIHLFNAMLDVLNLIPDLQEISLKGFARHYKPWTPPGSPIPTRPHSPFPHTVRLPQLRRLSVDVPVCAHHDDVSVLLASITLPLTACVDICAYTPENGIVPREHPGVAYACSIATLCVGLVPVAARPPFYTIEIQGYTDAGGRGQTETGTLSVRMDPLVLQGPRVRATKTVRTILHMLSPGREGPGTGMGSLTTLELQLADAAFTRTQWARLFCVAPRLRRLAVRGGSCRGLLRALHPGTAERRGTRGATEPLRELEELEVVHANGPGIHEMFPALVEARAREGFLGLRLLVVHAPEGSRPMSHARSTRLRALVGEVRLLPLP